MTTRRQVVFAFGAGALVEGVRDGAVPGLRTPRRHGRMYGMATMIRNFQLPLPQPTYRRLREAANRAKQPATVVARYAIETWLREQRKAALHEAIAAYAAKMAGTPADLDPDLEAAALELWAPPKKSRRRNR